MSQVGKMQKMRMKKFGFYFAAEELSLFLVFINFFFSSLYFFIAPEEICQDFQTLHCIGHKAAKVDDGHSFCMIDSGYLKQKRTLKSRARFLKMQARSITARKEKERGDNPGIFFFFPVHSGLQRSR